MKELDPALLDAHTAKWLMECTDCQCRFDSVVVKKGDARWRCPRCKGRMLRILKKPKG